MVAMQLLVASALVWTGEPNGKVLEFTMERSCRPCQMMSPIVSRLQRQGYPIEKIDLDHDKETPARYGVDRYPTFILVVDGNEVERRSGMMSEESLKALCARIPARKSERPAQRRKSVEPGTPPIELGEAAPLPKAAPAQLPVEKPGLFDRLLSRKKKETHPAAPSEVRSQGEDASAGTSETPPVTPLSATVRLRVKDSGGDSLGTGTIVESRPGQTLILTCGHIFRHWSRGSQVHVDLFDGEKSTTIVGKKLAVELNDDAGIDVALIGISTDQPLPACRVAPSEAGILAGAPVSSVGCGGGERPTVQRQKITSLNRYRMNDIECSAIPVEGRSGGGLFDRNSQVIGVCMCADPKYREGLYAGLKTIHAFLDRQNLSRLYRAETAAEPEAPQIASAGTEAATPDLGEVADQRAVRTLRSSGEMAAATAGRGEPAELPLDEEDVVGSEVVIIIRSRAEPGSPSKVVRLHRASRGFWEDLLPEFDPRKDLQETALKSATHARAPRSERRQVHRLQSIETRADANPAAPVKTTAEDPHPYRRLRSASRHDLVGPSRFE